VTNSRGFRRVAVASGTLAIVVALVLSGCTSGGDDGPDIIRVNGSEPANPLTPADTDELGGYRILQALYAGLVTYDESGTAIDDLAESIEANADNTVYTITIRNGSTFSTGEPVTANSFVDAWDWIALASHDSVNQHFFSDIAGYDAENDSSLVAAGGLVVTDDDAFEVHLRAPSSDFPQRLGHPVFSPMPDAYFEDPVAFAQHPIGNGPYMLDGEGAWKHGKRLQLVVNPDYEGEREPDNDGLTMVFYDSLDIAYADLLSGNLDVLDTLPEASLDSFEGELGNRDIDQPLAVLESITIPSAIPHFAGPEGLLRRTAISAAFDRTAIAEKLFGVKRVAARDFASSSLDTFDPALSGSENLTYDADEAVALWGQADELSPWEGTFEIAYNTDGGHQEWVDAVAAQISSTLGIEAVGKPYPSYAALQDAISDGSVGSAYRTIIRAEYPGVLPFLKRYPGTSAEFTALLGEAAVAKTKGDAQKAYTAAQTLLLTELPALPLWNSTTQAGYAEGLEDVAVDWRGIPIYDAIKRP
jgi:oligopeptide transport system substrate-binding protein